MADTSNSIEIPAWVTQVCGPNEPVDLSEVSVEAPRGVEPGMIYLATGLNPATTPSEIVLVTAVHRDERYVEICLAHHHTDAATEFDIALDLTDSGMIAPVVLQGDTVGVVWMDQLRQPLGRVATKILNLLPALSEGRCPDGYGPKVGLPLTGTDDWRWTFKEAQIDSLNAICGDCTGRLLDGESMESKWIDPSAAAQISKGLDDGWTEFVTVPEAFNTKTEVCGTRVSSSREDLQGYFDPTMLGLARSDNQELRSRVIGILSAPGVKPLPTWAETLEWDFDAGELKDRTGSPIQISKSVRDAWLRKAGRMGEPSQLDSGSPIPRFTVVEEELVAA